MSEYTESFSKDSLKPEQDIPVLDLTTLFHEQVELNDNPEVKEAVTAVLDALTGESVNDEQLHRVWIEYGKIVESVVDSIEDTEENPESRSKAQIAAILNKALIFQFAGNALRYLEELDIAEVYISNEGFEDISIVIREEIRTQVEQLELIPEVIILKLKGILDENNREFLREQVYDGLDLEDLIGHVYGMLLDEGEDPDEVLARIGITHG